MKRDFARNGSALTNTSTDEYVKRLAQRKRHQIIDNLFRKVEELETRILVLEEERKRYSSSMMD